MRRRNWAALGLIFVMAGCGASVDDTNVPSRSPNKVETSPSPAASPAPKKAANGSSATFRHFRVTVARLTQTKSQAKLLAKVCVRSLPPDPQGDRTRISWDPWSIRAGGKTVKPTSGTFPREATYRKGQCASGSMIFKTSQKVAKIKYANFVGNKAVWDAGDLSAKPETETTETTTPHRTTQPRSKATYYRNCAAVRRAGKAPIHLGEPGYARHLDRDGDGVGCEE
jgi:hypothetical protein